MPNPTQARPLLRRTLAAFCACAFVAGAALGAQSGPPAEPAAKSDQGVAVTPAPAPRALDPQALRARLSTIFDGTFLDSENGQDFVQTQGYLRLIELLAAAPAEEAHEKAAKKVFDWKAAMDDPDAWRGEWVSFRGVLADDFAAEKLVTPVHGETNLWRGFVLDAPEGDYKTGFVAFDMLFPPEKPLSFTKNDHVELEGVFYRTLHFESRAGVPRDVPYLIVRTLRHYQAPATAEKKTEFSVGGIAALVGAGLLIAFHLTQLARAHAKRKSRLGLDPNSPDFHRLFQERLQREKSALRSGSHTD